MYNIKNVEKNNNNKFLAMKAYLNLCKYAKKAFSVTKVVGPYVISAATIFGLFSLVGAKPFIRDTHKLPLHIEGTLDNKGNENISTFYSSDSYKNNGTITYISKWNKINDNKYERVTKTYNISNANIDTIRNYLNKNTSIKTIEDVFGRPISKTVEVETNITDEILNSEDVIKASIYDIDKNDVIYVKEKAGSNLAGTLLSLFILAIPSTVIGLYQYDELMYNIYDAQIDWKDADRDYREDLHNLEYKCRKKGN